MFASCFLFFDPRWRRHVPLKLLLTFNGLHGAISQKIKLFITTAVRTSDCTNFSLVAVANILYINIIIIIIIIINIVIIIIIIIIITVLTSWKDVITP
jgi:hypothetical protein